MKIKCGMVGIQMIYIGNIRLVDIGTRLLLSGYTWFTKKYGNKDSCFLSGKLCSTYFPR